MPHEVAKVHARSIHHAALHECRGGRPRKRGARDGAGGVHAPRDLVQQAEAFFLGNEAGNAAQHAFEGRARTQAHREQRHGHGSVDVAPFDCATLLRE